ncbi:MAG: hypothetical protein R6U15_00445 [Candidatus Izemoplasmatales bacterium]
MKKLLIIFITFMIFSFIGCEQFVPTTTNNQATETTIDLTTTEDSYPTTINEVTTDDSTENTSSTTEEATSIETTNETTTTEETTTEETTTEETTTEETTTVETTTEETTVDEVFQPNDYSLIQDELDYVGIPSIGDVKLLVFAVDFPDNLATDIDPSIEDIDLAFNGNSNQLSFESVNSFYLKSSYGKLNLTADIFGYYTLSETSDYYQTENELYYETDPDTGEYIYGEDEVIPVESEIISELLAYYDSTIDYNDYDSNNDGYIDGIYVIYNHPTDDSELWWAYQSYYAYYEDTYDGLTPNYYTWASNEFIENENEDINARTYIHETGHMLGLDDYYDYSSEDNYNSGGLGTFMMDYAIGDHDPFSKILLGWINPIVIDRNSSIDILPHLENGDVLLIIDEWNGTIFDEYLLITYYTPEGLNSHENNYIFTDSGIIIFHISAEIGNGYDPNLAYYSIFNNNNTDTQDKLIKIIEADMDNDIFNYELVENTDLFQVGDIFGDSIYEDYYWYDDTQVNITINIISISDDLATIDINFE